jgi:hypothetical protein
MRASVTADAGAQPRTPALPQRSGNGDPRRAFLARAPERLPEDPVASRPSRFAVAFGEPCPDRRTPGRDEPARPRRSRITARSTGNCPRSNGPLAGH